MPKLISNKQRLTLGLTLAILQNKNVANKTPIEVEEYIDTLSFKAETYGRKQDKFTEAIHTTFKTKGTVLHCAIQAQLIRNDLEHPIHHMLSCDVRTHYQRFVRAMRRQDKAQVVNKETCWHCGNLLQSKDITREVDLQWLLLSPANQTRQGKICGDCISIKKALYLGDTQCYLPEN